MVRDGQKASLLPAIRSYPQKGYPSRLLAATRHVVDQRPVDVGTTETNGIEEGLGIRDKVLLVGEFIGHDLGVAGFEKIRGPDPFVLLTRWSSGRTLQSQKECSFPISS